MGHITIPHHVISRMSKMNLWTALKKHPQYWTMVSASFIAVPSMAFSSMFQKATSFPHLYERDSVKLQKDEKKYERFLQSNK